MSWDTASGGELARGSDGLDRSPLRHLTKQVLLIGVEFPLGAHRPHERLDYLRIDHRTAGGDLPDRAGQLVALRDPVLEQIRVTGSPFGEKRNGILRVVVLRENHNAGARMQPANLLGGLDAFTLEARGHADVGHDYLWSGRTGAGHERVVVGRDADDGEVGLDR
jgi:hypothetical protein